MILKDLLKVIMYSTEISVMPLREEFDSIHGKRGEIESKIAELENMMVANIMPYKKEIVIFI